MQILLLLTIIVLRYCFIYLFGIRKSNIEQPHIENLCEGKNIVLHIACHHNKLWTLKIIKNSRRCSRRIIQIYQF